MSPVKLPFNSETKDLSRVLSTLELLKQRFGHVFFVHLGSARDGVQQKRW
jgi:pyruvate formate-lyase activating enzyme-like uncharacterized protein